MSIIVKHRHETKCFKCNKDFKKPKDLKKHLLTFHDGMKLEENIEEKEIEDTLSKFNFVKCSYCPDIMAQDYIESHVTENHGSDKILIFR